MAGSSLGLAGTGRPHHPEQVAESEAGVLFQDRARAVHPGFGATPRNAAMVADLCRWLDGIPLAIELAAARMKLLAIEDVAERLRGAVYPASESRPHRPNALADAEGHHWVVRVFPTDADRGFTADC